MSVEWHIRKTFCVSSAHVPWKGCAERIDNDQRYGAGRARYFDGKGGMFSVHFDSEGTWAIFCDDYNHEAARNLGWAELAALIVLARDHGCRHLEIDGSAPDLLPEYGFASFEWEDQDDE